MKNASIRRNDTVEILSYPIGSPNRLARVEEVTATYVVVTNANQPFMGTLYGKKFNRSEVRKVTNK